MTATAQMALRRIMEKYTANTRFCIIANYTHKLSPALLSRCTRFRFSPLKEADIRFLVDKVIEEEGVKIEPDAIDSLVRLSKGDMRRALNVLQACHASSMDDSLNQNRLEADTTFRYPPTHKIQSQPQASTYRCHNQQYNLRLHRRPSSIRYHCHNGNINRQYRCHIVSQHNQHTESK
jgi:DNA polymerase III delta prime subunit